MSNTTFLPRFFATLTIYACLIGAAGCHRGTAAKPDPNDDAPKVAAAVSQADKDERDRDDALKLDETSMVKLGIVVAPLDAATFHLETMGYGQVIGRDAVIQALADIEVAQVRATQSHAALERTRKLEGTAGADTIVEQETTIRQSAEDRSAVSVAQARNISLLGQQAAGVLAVDHRLVDGLSSGRYKLIRATLPLGAVHGDTPPALRFSRLDAAPGDTGWRAFRVWPGPVEAALPGRAFLAMVDAPALMEGERLVGYAADSDQNGETIRGALVPTSALVVVTDDAWVYVEHEPGSFSRERLDTTRPVPAGYIVVGKLAPGTRVITSGASMLLSREFDVSPDD